MVEFRLIRRAQRLVHRAYAPQPVRSRLVHVGIWIGVCVACVGVGGAATAGWLRSQSAPFQQCAALVSQVMPVDTARADLERTRLELAQEASSRAAVQKTADASAAEVNRLTTELQFLRQQGQKRR